MVKAVRTVWSRGKLRDYIKELPIAIKRFGRYVTLHVDTPGWFPSPGPYRGSVNSPVGRGSQPHCEGRVT